MIAGVFSLIRDTLREIEPPKFEDCFLEPVVPSPDHFFNAVVGHPPSAELQAYNDQVEQRDDARAYHYDAYKRHLDIQRAQELSGKLAQLVH